MEKVIKFLFDNQDIEYKVFTEKLSPSVKPDTIIGVRVPIIRNFIKELTKDEKEEFINELPHKYYEENLLHAFLIGRIKDFNEIIIRLEEFLPYCNGWALTDTICPKVLNKHQDELLPYIKKWIYDEHVYTERFAIWCLMAYYLEDHFNKELLLLPLNSESDDYYVKIMIAWYYATALAKKYDDTIGLLESKKLDKWIQNKTIQKANESYRISEENKEYLKTLKIK